MVRGENQCFDCKRFISWAEYGRNHMYIQAPWSFDPEAIDEGFCDRCGDHRRKLQYGRG